MKWCWEYVATFVECDYGAYVDWDEKFFECSECGELIHKSDYPYVDFGMFCPVCEFMADEAEEEGQ